MTPRIASVLTDIRRHNELDPNLMEDGAGTLPDSYQDNMPGTGEAENESNAQEMLDSFLENIVLTVSTNLGIDEDEAYDMVATAMDGLSEEGSIIECPGDDASIAEVGNWIGYAKTMGLDAMIMDAISDSVASGSGDED